MWIFSFLKRSGIIGINTHWEAGEKSDKEYQHIIDNQRPGFLDEINEEKIPPTAIKQSCSM